MIVKDFFNLEFFDVLVFFFIFDLELIIRKFRKGNGRGVSFVVFGGGLRGLGYILYYRDTMLDCLVCAFYF